MVVNIDFVGYFNVIHKFVEAILIHDRILQLRAEAEVTLKDPNSFKYYACDWSRDFMLAS